MVYRIVSRLGWPLLIALCVAPLVRWVTEQPLQYRFDGPIDTLLSLGQITGIMGLTFYAFNLFLATRFKILEDFFGGMNKVYIAHHLIGGIALIVVLAHPIFLALRLVPGSLRDAAMLLVPRFDHANLGVACGIIALTGMIVLLFLTFFAKLPYRVWLFTHKFLGAFFLFVGLHVLLTPNGVSADHVLRNYLLAVVTLGILAFIYRTLLPNMFVRRYWYTLVASRDLGNGVVEMTFRPDNKGLNFKAGQFLFISFAQDGMSSEWHPFTISSAPGAEVSITVKSLGSYTKTLNAIASKVTGLRARIEGAYGRFPYQNFGNTNQIWIAGGIGITPFLSMARALNPAPHNIDLYYSVKSEAELVDMDKLMPLQSATPNQSFRIIPFVADKQGFLTAEYIQKTSGLDGRDFLLCGPPPMMKALRQQLREMGVKNGHIHSEEFSMS